MEINSILLSLPVIIIFCWFLVIKLLSTQNKKILILLGLFSLKIELLIYILNNSLFININLMLIFYGMLLYLKEITGYSLFIKQFRKQNPIKIMSLYYPINKIRLFYLEKKLLILRIKKGLITKTLSIKSLILIFGLFLGLFLMYRICKSFVFQQLGIFIFFGIIIKMIQENMNLDLINAMRKVSAAGKKVIEKIAGVSVTSVAPFPITKCNYNGNDAHKAEENLEENSNKKNNNKNVNDNFNNNYYDNSHVTEPSNDFFRKEKKKYCRLANDNLDKETQNKLNNIVLYGIEYVNPKTKKITNIPRKLAYKYTPDFNTGDLILFNPKETPYIDHCLNIHDKNERFNFILDNIFSIRKEYRTGQMNKYEFAAIGIPEGEIADIKEKFQEKKIKFNYNIHHEIFNLSQYRFFGLGKPTYDTDLYSQVEIEQGKGTNEVSFFLNEALMPYVLLKEELDKNLKLLEGKDYIFFRASTEYKIGEADGFIFLIETEDNEKIVESFAIQAKCSQSITQMTDHIYDFLKKPKYQKTPLFFGFLEDGVIILHKDTNTLELKTAYFSKTTEALKKAYADINAIFQQRGDGYSEEVQQVIQQHIQKTQILGRDLIPIIMKYNEPYFLYHLSINRFETIDQWKETLSEKAEALKAEQEAEVEKEKKRKEDVD